jgi:hypothetical protein
VSVAERCRGRRVVVLVLESCRAAHGGLACAGGLPRAARRAAVRGTESYRRTEAFACYHADNFPCCGNSPPGGREVSRDHEPGALITGHP